MIVAKYSLFVSDIYVSANPGILAVDFMKNLCHGRIDTPSDNGAVGINIRPG